MRSFVVDFECERDVKAMPTVMWTGAIQARKEDDPMRLCVVFCWVLFSEVNFERVYQIVHVRNGSERRVK